MSLRINNSKLTGGSTSLPNTGSSPLISTVYANCLRTVDLLFVEVNHLGLNSYNSFSSYFEVEQTETQVKSIISYHILFSLNSCMVVTSLTPEYTLHDFISAFVLGLSEIHQKTQRCHKNVYEGLENALLVNINVTTVDHGMHEVEIISLAFKWLMLLRSAIKMRNRMHSP